MWYFVLFIVIVAIGVYLNSPAVKGRRSERAITRRLSIDSILRNSGKIMTNIYIPKESGETSEIDLLYITTRGLFVIENKNYAGYIFGSEQNKSWTVTLYAGKTWRGGNKVEKYQFYNPIWQNRTHIKHLKSYLNSDVKIFSLIAFSDRGNLKDVNVNSPDVYVFNHSNLSKVLRAIWDENDDIMNENQIDEIYNNLIPLTNVDKSVTQKHISDIQNRFGSTDICPICGNNLVLRTAKKGSNVGNQFYGCSNYPNCKYIKNI